MKIKILMMLKNEDELVTPWGIYHGELVGYDNIVIFDNGSTSEQTISALRALELRGVHVHWRYSSRDDFFNKGTLISTYISDFDDNAPADFYFPLDCDEFIGVIRHSDGCASFDQEDISHELAHYLNTPDILMIGAAYDNHPAKPGYYRPSPTQRKCFFAQGACLSLNRGFHVAKAKHSNLTKKTNIIYVHYHYKPFSLVQAHSRQKLEGQVDNFDPDTLINYRNDKKPGFHLINHLLHSNEDSYLKIFNDTKYIHAPAFEQRMNQLHLKLPFT